MAKILKATVNFLNNRPAVEKSISEAFLERATGRSLLLMERNIKVATPVREGHLKRSIFSRSTGFGKGEVRTAAVEGGQQINYAVFVEYGTRHQAPAAMFRKGVANSEAGIKEIFSYEAYRVAKGFPLK